MGQSWSRWQRHRNAKALRELAPKKTPGHDKPLPDLTRDTLLSALRTVATYLAKRKCNTTVIAVGGAVNTIHLRSRGATHDVDFFNDSLTPTEFEHLIKGAREAVKFNARLDESWFNNRTIFFIPRAQREALTEQAFAQQEVVFREPGLTVLAAPWQYAFCCKVDRLAGGGLNPARAYDLDDAVQYLHRYLTRCGAAEVQDATVRGWFVEYRLRWTSVNDAVIGRVNSAYRAKFHLNHNPIACITSTQMMGFAG